MPSAIIVSPATRLDELEGVIRYGLKTFVEVGNALKEIAAQKLYREQGYSTFEEYCKKRWNLNRRTAYDRIHAAEVVENVRASAQSLPSCAQAVELAVLDPDQQRDVAANVNFSTTTVKDLKERVRSVTCVSRAVSVAKAKEETTEQPVGHVMLGRGLMDALATIDSYCTAFEFADLEKARAVWPKSDLASASAKNMLTHSIRVLGKINGIFSK